MLKTRPGYTDCLVPIYAATTGDSLLHLVLTAVSLAVAGSGNPRSFRLAQSAFGKALSRTKKAIEDPEESLTDETLMAVLMLGLYEVRSPAVGNPGGTDELR